MTIFKCLVAISDHSMGELGEQSVRDVDTIEYQGKMWLVPRWLDTPDPKVKKPARLICLDGLHHQEQRGQPMGDYVLNERIPKDVLDGPTQLKPSDKYVVIENPEIQIRFHD